MSIETNLCTKHAPLVIRTVPEAQCNACRLEKENAALRVELEQVKKDKGPYKKTWE